MAAFSERSRCYVAGIGLLFTLAGCSGLTTVPSLLRVPYRDVSSRQVVPRQLEDASGKELAIALETSRLAEERGLDNDAISALMEVRRLDPASPGISHRLAVLYDRTGRTDAALREYSKALQENPRDADLHCDYGYFLYSTGQSEQAEASLRESLRLAPDHRQATINLALVIGTQGRFDESLQLFTQAIGPAAARHNVGMLMLRHGDPTSAKAMLIDASQRDPSIQQSPHVLAWMESGTRNRLELTKGGSGADVRN